MSVVKGSTNVSVFFYITEDVGGTNPGEPKTGMAFGDLTSASYIRQGAVRVAITPVTQTVAGAHTDGGFVEVDATNAKGLYRFDIPDAAAITGVDFVAVVLLPAGAQNAVASPLLLELVNDIAATAIVSGGAIDTTSGAVDAVSSVTGSVGSVTAINTTGGAIDDVILVATTTENTDMRGTDGSLTDKTGFSLSTSGILAIWHQLTSAIVTAGTVGKLLKDNVNDTISSRMPTTHVNATAGKIDAVALVDVTTENTDMVDISPLATSAALAIVDTNVDDIETAVAGLNDLGSTDINTEVVDALNVDTYAEPGQGTPGSTLSLAGKINYIYKAWRNKSTQNATTYSLFNDDASTVDHKATISDDGTTATKGEVATGP